MLYRIFCFVVLLSTYFFFAIPNLYFIDRIDVYGVLFQGSESQESSFGYFWTEDKRSILGKAVIVLPEEVKCDFATPLAEVLSSGRSKYSVDFERGLLCENTAIKQLVYKKIFTLDSTQASVEKITKLFVDNSQRIFIVAPSAGKVLEFFSDKSGVFEVDLKGLSSPGMGRIHYLLLGCLGILICVVFASRYATSVRSAIKEQPATCVLVLFCVTAMYICLFPGIFGMDLIVKFANNSTTFNMYSTIYSLMMNLFYTIDYTSIVPVSCGLFVFSFLFHSSRLGHQPLFSQVFTLLPIIMFLCLPAFILSIYGLQRIPFTNMIFLTFLSTLLYFVFYKDVTSLSFSIILFLVLFLLRIEYIIFVIPLIYILKSNIPFIQHAIRKILLSCGVAVLLFVAVQWISGNNYDARGFVYRSIMLHAWTSPYVSESTQLHKYFLTQGIHNEHNYRVTENDYKNALTFFAKNVFDNPHPYFNGVMSRFSWAMLGKDTWGHSFNKYKLSDADWSYHAIQAFNFFLPRLEVCPFGRNIYDSVTGYIQDNRPFFLNGILISFVVIFFVFPLFFRCNMQLLSINIAMMLKFMFTLLFSPAGYALYYYDLVIYVCIVSYAYFIFSKMKKT